MNNTPQNIVMPPVFTSFGEKSMSRDAMTEPAACTDKNAVSTAVLNNLGVDHLSRGNVGLAIIYFRDAFDGLISSHINIANDHHETDDCIEATYRIRCATNEDSSKSSTRSAKPCSNNVQCKSEYPQHWMYDHVFARHIVPLQFVHNENRETSSAAPSYQYIHAHCLYLLPQSNAYCQTNSLKNSAIVSSIIMYNMALVFHLSGVEGSNHACYKRMETARSLYCRASNVLKEAMVLNTSLDVTTGDNRMLASGCIIVDYLYMAILNNLGHAHFHMDEYEPSKICFGQFVPFFVSMTKNTNYRRTPVKSITKESYCAPYTTACNETEEPANTAFLGERVRRIIESCRVNFTSNASLLRRPHLAPSA